jgi:hypothetical protein
MILQDTDKRLCIVTELAEVCSGQEHVYFIIIQPELVESSHCTVKTAPLAAWGSPSPRQAGTVESAPDPRGNNMAVVYPALLRYQARS